MKTSFLGADMVKRFLCLFTLIQGCYAQVPHTYQLIGDKYGVDGALMYALATTESGKKNSFGAGVMPWPWTTNICDRAPGVRCKGYWFDTREELYEKLMSELRRGNDWFDVGPMQMNWHFHKNRFGADLWLATHPLINVNQAAGLLLEIQKRHKKPIDIYAAYHAGIGWKSQSYTERRQKQIQAYANKTSNTYQKIKQYGVKNNELVQQ